MGVFLAGGALPYIIGGLPHARGGVSAGDELRAAAGESSPRPWGCFLPLPVKAFGQWVFPTPVGVFLPFGKSVVYKRRLPHARGGVSKGRKVKIPVKVVFPTPVGVFRKDSRFLLSFRRLPHARGGVSVELFSSESRRLSSPRPWGCFFCRQLRAKAVPVFPTPVGVFQKRLKNIDKTKGLPHARGGVSQDSRFLLSFRLSSPRPWGCFHGSRWGELPQLVFPTPVGVFRTGRDRLDSFCRLPHARGGVSGRTKRPAKNFASSPRPWGCFPGYKIASHRPAVFPTPVGVFPFASARRFTAPGLPHARGGVSTGRDRLDSFCPSSPRPWGCFYF